MVLQVPPSFENTKDMPIRFPANTSERSRGEGKDDDEKQKKVSQLKKFGIAGLAAVTILAGGITIGANVSAKEQAPPVATEPAETTPTEPTETDPVVAPETEDKSDDETETELSYEEQVAALEIPAGLDKDELATTFVADRLTQWLNAGCEDSLSEDTIGQTWDEALPLIAEENAKLFSEALFIEGWEQETANYLPDAVDAFRDLNLNTLNGYVSTQWSDKPENIEGFKSWYTVNSVNETSNRNYKGDRVRRLYIAGTQHWNDDKNVYDTSSWYKTYNITVDFYEVDGIAKVSYMGGFMSS